MTKIISENEEIHHGTRQRTGYDAIKIEPQMEQDLVPIKLSWKNIRITANNGRVLLNNISGEAGPGELVALMGASGAGKTTLLNALMSRNKSNLETKGSVTVNGHEMGDSISKISGFAQQQEAFIPTLTVFEYLMIQAKLRIQEDIDKEHRVNEVIELLGLTKCQDVRIGLQGVVKGISGGEARRLTFACELLSNRSLIFADEPTSGLDSFMAENVVQIMKKLSDTGRTIICTIHQPTSEIYFLFDKVIYLTRGSCAFIGTPQESIEFFEECGLAIPKGFNPPEWILSQIAIEPGNEKEAEKRIEKVLGKFEASDYSKGSTTSNGTVCNDLPKMHENVGFLIELGALLKRSSIDIIRSPNQLKMRVIQKIIMGLFVGSLYWQQPLTVKGVWNTSSALYFLLAELTFSTMFGIITFMENELSVVIREYHDGLYNTISYYLSRCLVYLPLFSLDGLLMMLICYWMIGLQSTGTQVLGCLLISVLIEQAATACGIFFACLFSNSSTAMAVCVPTSGLFALLSGLYGDPDAMPEYIKWMKWISWFRYGFEGLMVNQWWKVDHPMWSKVYQKMIMDRYSFNADNYWIDVIGLAVITATFYVLGFLALLCKIRRSR